MTRSDCETQLESGGFHKSVAGEQDFSLALRVMETVLPTNKGLIIAGVYGCGKTTLAKAMFPKALLFSMPFDAWILGDSQDAKDLRTQTIIIDDLGCESEVSDYGVKREPFAEMLCQRYTDRESVGRLIITTNLNEQEMANRYGGRVVSKLKELCFATRLTGNDKRKWETIR